MLKALTLGPSLVLKKFHCDPQTGVVDIQGRAPGLWAWLLALMKIDATTTLYADPHHVNVRMASLFGETNETVPTTNIASLEYGFMKPVQLLILGAIFFLGGFFGMFQAGWMGLFMLAGIVFGVLYFLNKRMYIALVSNGASRMGLQFKRSVIENVPVDIVRVQEALGILHQNILWANGARWDEASPEEQQ